MNRKNQMKERLNQVLQLSYQLGEKRLHTFPQKKRKTFWKGVRNVIFVDCIYV